MAPSATTDLRTEDPRIQSGLSLPENTAKRLIKAGIDPTAYPTRPQKPDFLDQVYAIRSEPRYSASTFGPFSLQTHPP